MLITKVELEDIKSHKHFSKEFEPGTTAITGANGAGKTTIIEAIAWALFDFLEYNRDDFARRGAKKGAARVTFQSGLDDKRYTVIRETTGKHRVVDEENKTVVAEQNANVVNFMRQHLQVEPGTNLKELYRAAIGVPQGTFTAVFLDNATTRKAVFDRLLKVEEYKQSSEKLKGTVKLIEQKQQEVNLRLAVAENELKQLETIETEHNEVVAEVAKLETEHGALATEVETRQQRINEFETAKARLERAADGVRGANAAHDAAVFQLENVAREQTAAEIAVQKTRELEPDYRVYLDAETERHALERARDERDQLRVEKNQIEKNQIDAKARAQFLSENLKKSIEAAETIALLAPQIAEEELLNAEHKTLLEARADSNAARKTATDLQTEIDAKRSEWQELRTRIKDGEKGAEAEARVAQLEQEFKKADRELNEADQAATSLALLKRQGQDQKSELEKLRANLEKIEIEIGALEKFALAAARVGEFATVETALAEKIANLRARIELDQKFQQQASSGVCPIMPDKCLNLRESQNLNGYLTTKSAANKDALKNFEIERERNAAELKSAREAEKNHAKLQPLRGQAEQIARQIEAREKSIAELRREIIALSAFSPEKHDNLRVAKTKIESDLKFWREAATKFAALEGLRRQIQNLADDGKKLSAEKEKQEQIARRFDAIEQHIETNQKRLAALDNPRARAETLRREAARESELRANLREITEKIEQFETARERIERELERFAALDEKLATVRADLARTQTARDEYLRNRAIAERLPELNQKLAELKSETARLAEVVQTAKAEFEAANAAYNAENHRAEQTALDAARTNAAAIAATLHGKKARKAQLHEVLRRLNAVRDKLHDDLQEQERLRKISETTDYIRDTLKKAAPHVGEILRREVAREATQMFRDVTNEVGRSLLWTDDYEILLDENGYQRPFANLSGGEQMAAALSIRLALLTQLSDVRIAFFDEPTTNLDKERRERLAQQIGQIRNFNQLFVISHDDTFHSNVDNTIPVGEMID